MASLLRVLAASLRSVARELDRTSAALAAEAEEVVPLASPTLEARMAAIEYHLGLRSR
jgi:hypothetical protein